MAVWSRGAGGSIHHCTRSDGCRTHQKPDKPITDYQKTRERKENMFKSLVSKLTGGYSRVRTFCVLCIAAVSASVVVAAPALATGSETKEKVGEVAGKVGSEGVEIVIAILTALVALIVAIIIIPKAVGLIKRFI